MTAPRMIPENPQPGERYAEWMDDVQTWYVWSAEDAEGERNIDAIDLTERDARLLVFGPSLIDVVNRTPITLAFLPPVNAVLANLEVPT